MTPELLSFVSFSAGVFISCTVFVFVLRGRVIISRKVIEDLTSYVKIRADLQARMEALLSQEPTTHFDPPKPE